MVKPYKNTTLDDETYKITKSDIKAMQNILKTTHSFTLVCMGEKQLPNHWKLFTISAPDTRNDTYTGTGQNIYTAADGWFNRVEEVGRPHRRRKDIISMIKRIQSGIRSYVSTLFSGIMLGFVVIHTSEDILLMSIGRFVPLPLLAMYGLGLIVSWLVMGCLITKIIKHKPHH